MGWNKRLTVVWLLASIVITVAVTGVLWFVFHVPVFVGFLLLPFLWSLRWFSGGSKDRSGPADQEGVCPVCGRQAREPGERYCARDGARLRES